MALRKILHIPDPMLRKICAPVQSVDDEIKMLIHDMFETMYDAPGIGLAAPQIGMLQRVITLDVSKEDEKKQPLAMINPEITHVSDILSSYEEGCLSIPDYYDTVQRPNSCTVAFLDEDGVQQTIKCTGLLATAVQHEIDHLNGKLFIDYLSRLKRERVQKRFAKRAKRDPV